MGATPQGSALPIVQTLAGLFGGLVNARQQYQANPRFGMSLLPILAGGASGLATGLQGAATRAEELRQEGRKTDDARAQYLLQSGMSDEELNSRLGGHVPMGYQATVGDAARQGAGNVAAANALNIPTEGKYSLDSKMADTLFGQYQKNLAIKATSDALGQAQSAGANDAGGNQTTNALMLPVNTSLTSMLAPMHQALFGALNTGGDSTQYPMTRFRPVPGSPFNAAMQNQKAPTGNPSSPLSQLLLGKASMSAPNTPVFQSQPVDLGYRKDLAQNAMEAVDPHAVINQYTATANAVNGRNTQMTSLYNTAENNRADNEQAALKRFTPSIAGIISEGSPEANQRLNDYAAAGATVSANTMKPATHADQDRAVKVIEGAKSSQEAQALIKHYEDTGVLNPGEGKSIYNSGRHGQYDPIDGAAPPAAQSAPAGALPNIAPGNGPAVAPRITDFIPNFYPNIQTIQRSSMGAVNKKARENNGSPSGKRIPGR